MSAAQDYLDELFDVFGVTRFTDKKERWYKLEGVDEFSIDAFEDLAPGSPFDDGFKFYDCVWQDDVERVGDEPEYCVVRLRKK